MNEQHLTDALIRSAIDRRAAGVDEADLRERVLAATDAVGQRRAWRIPLERLQVIPRRGTALRLSLALLLLAVAGFIAAVAGNRVEPTPPSPLGALAYLSGGDLYVAGPAGESPRLIWDIPASEDLASHQLVWIDPETVLLHIHDQPRGIHVVNVITGVHRQLDEGSLIAHSPNRLLAAIAPFDDSPPPGPVRVIEIASGAVVAEIHGPISGYPARWSPDGRSILGESMDTVYRVDIASGETTDLATGLCCGLSPHWPIWSPDGTRVVYVDYHVPPGQDTEGVIANRDCTFRCGTLWTVAAAGGEPARLTPELGSETEPAFSPDGRWIAYLEESMFGERPTALVVIAADGSGRRVLGPGWLLGPDGRGASSPAIRWDADSAGLTYLSPFATLWHVTLAGSTTRIETPAISEFARQVLQ